MVKVKQDVIPIRWGLTRLFSAVAVLVVGLSTTMEYVTQSNPLELIGNANVSHPGGITTLVGVAVCALFILAVFYALAVSLLGFATLEKFGKRVFDRNWRRYRLELWRGPDGSIGWDAVSSAKKLERPPYGDFSLTAMLGRSETHNAVIWNWRSGLGEAVRGLAALEVPMPMADGSLETNNVVLSDASGNRLKVILPNALDYWIPQAAVSDSPSLAYAGGKLHDWFMGERHAHLNLADELNRSNELREQVTRNANLMQERFTEQHALAAAAIGVVWDAIWGIYKTRRFVGSSEGRELRRKLTNLYLSLRAMDGSERHDFNRYLPEEHGSPQKQQPQHAA